MTDGPPEDLVTAMFSQSADTERYREFVKNHGEYATELSRLETMEQMIEGYFTDVERLLPVVKDPATGAEPDKLNRTQLANAHETMKTAHSLRYYKKGMVFLSELDGLRTQVWTKEVETITPLFDDKAAKVKPLTAEEELALTENRGKFDPDEKIIPPLSRLLAITKSPMARDSEGNLANVARLTGRVQLYTGGGAGAVLPTMRTVTVSANAMVGILAAAGNAWVRDAESHTDEPAVPVAPLNDAATRIFGGVHMYLVPIKNLVAVSAQEVEKLKQAKPVSADEVP
jgi:hypothetical protein